MMSRDSWDRDALWLQGPSGTGKTSLAHIVANKLVETDLAVIELDGETVELLMA